MCNRLSSWAVRDLAMVEVVSHLTFVIVKYRFTSLSVLSQVMSQFVGCEKKMISLDKNLRQERQERTRRTLRKRERCTWFPIPLTKK